MPHPLHQGLTPNRSMILRAPDFYDRFKCIAGDCTDTCCIGWEIDIDKNSQERYRKLSNGKEAFARKIQDNIEDGHFKLAPGDRCPFLREDNLCEMICQLGVNGTDKLASGENILCDICREHPRFTEVYGDIMEKGVGLCCEEAARLLLDGTGSPLAFIEKEVNDVPDDIPEDAREARDAIFAEREQMFDILADGSLSLNERLLNLLDFAEQTQYDDPESEFQDEAAPATSEVLSMEAVKQTWIEILGEGESFGPAWSKAFERIVYKGWPTQNESIFNDSDGERIVTYMLFRYYAKSLFDGDFLGKVQFSIYFWIILRNFGATLAEGATSIRGVSEELSQKINAIKLLSKQTEYSEEIMGILADNFYENEAFSTENFRNLIKGTSNKSL